MNIIPPEPTRNPAPFPPPPDAGAAPASWTFSRVLALLGGAALSYITIRYSRGIGLAGFLGVLLLVKVQTQRGRRASRAGAWLAACLMCAAAVAVVFGYGFSKLPAGYVSRMMDSVRAQQKRSPPPVLPPALQRLQPTDSASRAAQRAVQEQSMAMVQSPGFLAWIAVVTVMVMSAILGVLLGTMSWGGASMLVRGVRGYWPLAAPPE
jgi:drug/metabolite transporter (DMT)-like permease